MSSVQDFVAKVFDGKSQVPLSELIGALCEELQTGKVEVKFPRQPTVSNRADPAILVEWIDKETKA